MQKRTKPRKAHLIIVREMMKDWRDGDITDGEILMYLYKLLPTDTMVRKYLQEVAESILRQDFPHSEDEKK